MPTGYTSLIQDGADFKQFALSCARAFGAAIMQRDDPSDTPLKTEYEPSDYHIKELEKANEQKEKLDSLTDSDWQLMLDNEFEAEQKRIAEYAKQEAETEKKYNSVLEKAKAWIPPTSDHVGIKEFMVKQIEDSINFDCKHYKDKKPEPKLSLEDFKSKKYDSVNWSINYHTKEHDAEVKRAKERTEWLTSYVNSLDI